jgi:hypothetical protein
MTEQSAGTHDCYADLSGPDSTLRSVSRVASRPR